MPIASPSDLDTYLGLGGTIDVPRATLLLALAEERCSVILTPLPPNARSIVLDVAQRAYTNVVGATSETTGPFSTQLPSIGVSLTASNRRELRFLAGRGGAFSIDPTPADAFTDIPIHARNVQFLNGVPILDEWAP